MGGYRHDMERARRRLAAADRRSLRDPRFGTIEYAESGEGPPVLMSHPLFAGSDAGPGLAELFVGPGHRFVAPSRFGYLGSSLPARARPADQADAYASLLDALGIDRAGVLGYSGGGPSAIQFALRHPDRAAALVLIASALPGKAGRPPQAVARLLFGSDLFFWTVKTWAPGLLLRMLGMPAGFRPTPGERIRIRETADSLFPIRPRKRGVLFDLYVSNPDVQGYPLEEIAVPTLLVNARDDAMSAFGNAAAAADRIPGARVVAFDRGGHLLLGGEERIREEVAGTFGRRGAAARPGAPERGM